MECCEKSGAYISSQAEALHEPVCRDEIFWLFNALIRFSDFYMIHVAL